MVWIPEEAEEVTLDLMFASIDADNTELVDLYLSLCKGTYDQNGFDPLQPESASEGNTHYVIPVSPSDAGQYWYLRTEGNSLFFLDDADDEFPEPVAYFIVGFNARLMVSNDTNDTNSSVTIDIIVPQTYKAQLEFGEPSMTYSGGRIEMARTVFNINALLPQEEARKNGGDDTLISDLGAASVTGALLILAVVLLVLLVRKRQPKDAEKVEE